MGDKVGRDGLMLLEEFTVQIYVQVILMHAKLYKTIKLRAHFQTVREEIVLLRPLEKIYLSLENQKKVNVGNEAGGRVFLSESRGKCLSICTDVSHHLADQGSNHGDCCTAGTEGLHLECKLSHSGGFQLLDGFALLS